MVPLQKQLPPWEGTEESKVPPRLLQAHAPGQIPAEHHGVPGLQHGQSLPQLLHISRPSPAEDIHGLVGAEGQVGISNGVQGHRLLQHPQHRVHHVVLFHGLCEADLLVPEG